MNSIRILDRRAGYVVAAFALLLATFIPALAFAAQVNARSIEMSNSSVGAENVTYKVTFTPAAAAQAYVIDFCTESPAIGQTCTAPDDFDATTASNYTAGVADDANTVVRTGTLVGGTPFTVDLTDIDNPSDAGTIYARIVTFPSDADAGAYTSAVPGANVVDEGGLALSITPTIGVSGTVAESLIFCVSGANTLGSGCDGAVTPPNVSLGTDGVLGTTTSDGTIYTQISTNAVSGAVVNLKSSTVGCGGLTLAGAVGAEACGIKPVITPVATIANNASQFGLKLGTVANGTGTIGLTHGYDSTNYFLDFDEDDEATGVTSTYGDTIFDTGNDPISNGEVPLIFGANIGDDTPAGAYSATLNLIATGKF